MPFEFDKVAMGKRIKAARKRAKMTQEQIAEQLDITKSAVSQWENGKTVPDVRPIIALCRASRDNCADEILLAAAAVRVTLEEKQLLQLMRELPADFRVALNKHINDQWELANPGKASPAAPFPHAKKAPV